MKLLRPLAGYTLYDHKTNDYICRELRITGILDKIDEYRRNWLQHLQRMPQNRIPLKPYHYRPQGRRTIGRPKKCWREQLLTVETERIKLQCMLPGKQFVFLFPFFFHVSRVLGGASRSYCDYCVCPYDDGYVLYLECKM